MPVIQGYQSRVGAPGPVERQKATPDAFGAAQAEADFGVGQAIAKAGDTAVALGDHMAKRAGEAEVSDVTAKMAKAQEDLTNRWRDIQKTADPGDPDIASKFMDEYQQTTAAIRDQIKTRDGQLHFDKTDALLHKDFSELAVAGQAELAGVKAKKDFQDTLRSQTSTLLENPSAYLTTKQAFDDFIESKRGTMPQTHLETLRDEGKKQLIEAAGRGLIDSNPVKAKAMLEAGMYNDEMSTDMRHQLIREAKVAIAGQEADARNARRDAAEALALQQTATENKFLNRLNDPADPEGRLTSKDILKSNLDPPQKRLYLNILDRGEGGENPKNPALFNDAIRRTLLPDGDPHKLTDDTVPLQWVSEGRMPYADAQKIRTEIQGRKSQDGQAEAHLRSGFLLDAQKQIVDENKWLGNMDKDGQDRFYQFQYAMEKKIKEQRAANKPIDDLYNPDSKDYLGKLIPQYKKDANSVIKDAANRFNPAPDPSAKVEQRLPTESPAAYLKRMRKQ